MQYFSCFLKHFLKVTLFEGTPQTDTRTLLRNLELIAVVAPFEREGVKVADEWPGLVDSTRFSIEEDAFPSSFFHSVAIGLNARRMGGERERS